MASATEEDSYDLCIIVEGLETPSRTWSLWSGYETLSMAELNWRFKYWNTECKYDNMDIAEVAVKMPRTIGELIILPRGHYHNDVSNLMKWMKRFTDRKPADPHSSDASSGSRQKQNLQSTVKTFRQREIMSAAGPTHGLLPVECFKNMKFSEQRFTQDLCRVKHLLFDHRGKHIIVASSTNQVQVWNLLTFQHENLIVRHGYDFHHIKYIELSADESLLIVGTDKGMLVVWDYKRRVELDKEKICNSCFKHFKLLPEPINGNYCLVIMDSEGDMAVWRLRYPKADDDSKVIERAYGSGPQVRCREREVAAIHCTFSVSSCGRYVARTSTNSTICVYTHNQNCQLVLISSQPLMQLSIDDIVWAHHSPRFITTSRAKHTVVWDANFKAAMTLKPKEENVEPGVVKAYWSADDVWIIIAIIPSSCIYVWDSVEGTIVNLIKTNLAHMMPHPVLPQLLATVVYGEIQLWDLTRIDDEPIHIFCTNNHFRHCNASKEVIWSPDGTVLIAPRSDGMLIMFNLTKGIRVIHAPTRAERLERRRETSTDRNIPNNADTSNNSSPAQLDFLLL